MCRRPFVNISKIICLKVTSTSSSYNDDPNIEPTVKVKAVGTRRPTAASKNVAICKALRFINISVWGASHTEETQGKDKADATFQIT